MRELIWMCDARNRAEWSRTSSIMALNANLNIDTKKHKAMKPTDFDPHYADAKKETAIVVDNMGDLKSLFVDVDK